MLDHGHTSVGHLIGEGLNYPEEHLSLVIPDRDSVHSFARRRNL